MNDFQMFLIVFIFMLMSGFIGHLMTRKYYEEKIYSIETDILIHNLDRFDDSLKKETVIENVVDYD